MVFESAAVIIPDTSILRGENGFNILGDKITKHLRNCKFDLQKISIVKENEKSLACELNLLIKLYDIVIIVINKDAQCISNALADISSQDLAAVAFLEKYFPESTLNIQWPRSVKLLKSSKTCPIVYLQRIFIVSSEVLEDQCSLILKDYLSHYQREAVYRKKFFLVLNGSRNIIETMRSDSLDINFEEGTEQISLTLVAKDLQTIVNGEIFLKNAVGPNILGSYFFDDMADLIYQSEDNHIQQSLKYIEKCLEDYGPDNVFLSFNGGKDCTVLLHLVQIVLQTKYPEEKGRIKLFCLYFRGENTFKEQDEFIEQCMIFYNLEVMCVTGHIKEALRVTIAQKPHLKACFMGTRRTDPFCSNLQTFQMTDSDWPEIMRCSPFLDWHYSDIWDYLLYFKVPYCPLYDSGFTSLGSSTNTIRNPSLLFSDGNKEIYLPAYKMLNERKERSGRNISKM